MSNDKKMLHDAATNEITIVELTDEEQAERDAEIIAHQNAKELKLAEAEARATQKAALLERLGITEDEARLLLG